MEEVRLEDAIEDAGGAITVRSEAVLVGWSRIAFVLLTAWLFVSIALFATYWVRLPDNGAHPVMFAVASIGVAYLIAVWIAPWLSLARMSRPVPDARPSGPRVAVVTTFVPEEESLELLEQSLAALVALDYPHDTWVLDEGDLPAARALCERLGARHFTRHGRPEAQRKSGRFAARTKFGNLNALARGPGVGRVRRPRLVRSRSRARDDAISRERSAISPTRRWATCRRRSSSTTRRRASSRAERAEESYAVLFVAPDGQPCVRRARDHGKPRRLPHVGAPRAGRLPGA